MSRPTVAIIDRQALRHNFALAQSLAPTAKCMPMVKANAYGHGALEVSLALAEQAPAYGVACIEEALDLRNAGIKQPILLLEGTFSRDEVDTASRNNFWLMVENENQKRAIIDAKIPSPITVWLGIDTGMHRLGFAPEDADIHYRELEGSTNTAKTIVIATHFACADDLTSEATAAQLALFEKNLATLNVSKNHYIERSMANSAAVLAWPQSHGNWQRPGYMIYGNSPFAGPQINADRLQPAMSLQTAVISLRRIGIGESVGYTANWSASRPSTIATLCVGYGDGYPRHAPNGTPVLIHGQRCPLVGRVSMDMITVDVTDLNNVAIGDNAVLWGPGLSVNDVASHCNTIGYELITQLSGRVPRQYLN
jgi:alanine racemase